MCDLDLETVIAVILLFCRMHANMYDLVPEALIPFILFSSMCDLVPETLIPFILFSVRCMIICDTLFQKQ